MERQGKELRVGQSDSMWSRTGMYKIRCFRITLSVEYEHKKHYPNKYLRDMYLKRVKKICGVGKLTDVFLKLLDITHIEYCCRFHRG